MEQTAVTPSPPSPLAGDSLIYSLAIAPEAAGNRLWLAARQSGLYRSDDAGQTWHSLYDHLPVKQALLTSAVLLSPNFGTDGLLLAGVKGGILRTTDRGENWRVMLFPPPAPLITTLVASPDFANDGILLAGTAEDGIFYSNARGMQWAAWNFGLLDLSVYCIGMSPAFKDNQLVYAGTETGLLQSTNAGRTWRALPFPIDLAPVVSLLVDGEGRIYAGTEEHGLQCSADEGRTWERLVPAAIPAVVNAIAADFPSPGAMTVLLESQAMASTDGGRHWRLMADFKQPVTALAAGTDAGLCLVGTATGEILCLKEFPA